MGVNQRFIAGRLRGRLLRPPVIEGWLCDERGATPEPAVLPLIKLRSDALGLRVPNEHDVIKLGAEATGFLTAGGELEVMIGWPETLLVVRRGGTALYGEGDPMHFGPLALDDVHAIARTGLVYLASEGAEVKVELTLSRPGGSDVVLLGPDQGLRHGPYQIHHERSYDPRDRPTSAPAHGYGLRLRRDDAARAPAVRPADVTSPLDVDRAEAVIALARARGWLGPDEVLLAETAEFARRLALYEGPRAKLEQAVREHGPATPILRRRGEAVEVTAALLARGPHGEAQVGRAALSLEPTGVVRVARSFGSVAPGRLRRP